MTDYFDSELETPISPGPNMTHVRLISINFNTETYADRSATLIGWKGHDVGGSMVYDIPFTEEVTGADFDTFVSPFKTALVTRLNQTLRVREVLGPNDSLTWWDNK